MATGINKEEARKALKKYESEFQTARRIATELGLEDVAKHLAAERAVTYLAFQIGISKANINEAESLESSDPKAARKLLIETKTILGENPPSDDKNRLIADIDRMLTGGTGGVSAAGSAGGPDGTTSAAGTEGSKSKSVFEEVKELRDASSRLAKEGKFKEARDKLGEAKQVAIEGSAHDLVEQIDDDASELNEKALGSFGESINNWLDKNILLSPSMVDDALKLVAVPGSTQAELEAHSPELDNAIKDTKAKLEEFIKKASGDEQLVKGVKHKLKKQVGDLQSRILDDELRKLGGADTYQKFGIHTGKLPDNEKEKPAYFCRKLANIISEIGKFAEQVR